MAKIFVNGISAKSGGGRSILTNFLKVACVADDDFTYVVVVPELGSYAQLANERVCLVPLPAMSRTMLIPLVSILTLPKLALHHGCKLVFTLADVPLRTRLPQIFLFDWPYAAFLESSAWQLSTRRDWPVRRAKLWFFRRLLPFVNIMIAQNGVLADQLRRHYGLRNVRVVPNAVSIDNLDGGDAYEFGLGDGFKFLCLSRYYSHKNIEIFLPLAERMKASGISARIITTISPDDGPGAAAFLSEITRRDLTDVIVNLGPVPMKWVPSLYRQTDALLLPTLLESFSGTYVEAMYHRKPIFTSRLPFAEEVCRSAAYYFDPHDPDSIFACLTTALENPDGLRATAEAAADLLRAMPDWVDAYRTYTNIFEAALQDIK